MTDRMESVEVLATRLLDFIDNEGPEAKAWEPITETAAALREALRASPAGGAVDFDAAALALGFRKLPNGKWYSDHPLSHHNFVKRWDSAEDIFDWWGRSNASPAGGESEGMVKHMQCEHCGEQFALTSRQETLK